MTDADLWDAFNGRSLSSTEWTHRAHLSVAWMHLDRFVLDEAHLRFRGAIIRLNAVHGVEETPARGYHETLTRTWLSIVAGARSGPRAPDAEAFCQAHPELLARDLPLAFYTRDRLFSIEARAMFVPPDRAPLPGG